jgi:hypothetical protein
VRVAGEQEGNPDLLRHPPTRTLNNNPPGHQLPTILVPGLLLSSGSRVAWGGARGRRLRNGTGGGGGGGGGPRSLSTHPVLHAYQRLGAFLSRMKPGHTWRALGAGAYLARSPRSPCFFEEPVGVARWCSSCDSVTGSLVRHLRDGTRAVFGGWQRLLAPPPKHYFMVIK